MTSAIKIAHLVSPTMFYGKEKWIIALLNHIDQSRFKSIVISIAKDTKSPFLRELKKMSVEYEVTKHVGRFDSRIIGEVHGIVKKHGINILHCHDYKSDVIGIAARRRSKVILISTPHGWSNKMDLKLRTYQLLDKLVLRQFDCVTPLSAELAESLFDMDPARMKPIPNFVDLSSMPDPCTYDKKHFCFIGRLIDLKRVEDAIKALSHTRDKEICLRIIGDGEKRKHLEDIVEREELTNRVSFEGFRSDALALLNASAALVIPSLTEGVSRVAMEAMALGKPVIGTDIQGIREIIEHDVTGILVPVKNPRAIAHAMDRLVNEPTLYESIKRAAQLYIQKERSASVVVHEFERLYESLAERLA